MKYLTLLIGLFCVINSFGQDLHDEVTKVFNFTPHKMTSDEQKAVYPKLDRFFDLVISNKDIYLEPLRNELKRNDNNPYFYFDGGLLLMEISQDENDIQLVADALVKVDIKDLGSKVFLEYTLSLSLKGANVIEVAFYMLNDTTLQVFIPQHVLTLNYGEVLKFILPRYSSELYIEKLISKYYSINSIDNKLTLLDLFVYSNCCQADEFLSSLINDNQQPQKIRDKVAETIKLTTVPRKKNDKKYSELFEERKEILNRISDEAIYELNEKSIEMRKTFECDKK